MKNDFAAIILTHGRADRVITYDTLRSQGYSGRIVILIDDLDKTRDDYIKKFGDQVYIFDKNKIKSQSDIGNNFNDLRSTTFPRNAMFEVAKELGLKSFIQLDDDYKSFRYKFDRNLNYIDDRIDRVKNLDKLFEVMSNYVLNTPITSFCFAQGGDFIGGKGSSLAINVRTKRKGMNSFICATDRPFSFIGQMNEDVNTVIKLGSEGKIFLMTNQISLDQLPTQSNAGGMSEIYIDSGTYVKTFYSVMYHPSSAKVHYLNSSNRRLHHRISWKFTAPKILRETQRKASQ